MVIDIIGPGAIGLLTALSLPEECTVRLRHPHWQQKQDVVLTDDSRRSRSAIALPLAAPEPVSAAVVTTKAGQALPAVKAVLPALAKNAELLLLHNGLGPQDEVTDLLAARPDVLLLAGVTAQGAIRCPPAIGTDRPALQVRHTGRGDTYLGPWQGQCARSGLGDLLVRSAMQATWLDNAQAIRTRVWAKLIVNCAINPLTALLQVPNGSLLSEDCASKWQPVVKEATTVAQAEGIHLVPGEMVQQTRAVIQQTRENYSSMYQDVRHHNPTEAAFILDPIILRARKHGIEVPAIQALKQALESLV